MGLALASVLLLTAILAVWGTTGRFAYGFLVVNLGLAWIPVALAALLATGRVRGRLLVVVPLGLVWLLFLPNAPYLVTDLVHAGEQAPLVPLRVDLAILLMAAVCGVLAWAVSLRLFELALRTRFGLRTARVVAIAAAALAGVGICVGRVLRWNSWDVVTRPAKLLDDVAAAVADPVAHARGLTVMLVAAALLGALALAQSLLDDRKLPIDRVDQKN